MGELRDYLFQAASHGDNIIHIISRFPIFDISAKLNWFYTLYFKEPYFYSSFILNSVLLLNYTNRVEDVKYESGS